MQMYVASDYRGIIDQKMRLQDIVNRYGITMEQLQAPVKGMVDEIQKVPTCDSNSDFWNGHQNFCIQ